MNSKTNHHRRIRAAHAVVGSRSFIQFVGVIFAIVCVVWVVDAFSVTNAVSVETTEIPVPENNDEVVAFSLDVITSLATYYDSIGTVSTDSDDKLNVFASVVYRRGALNKLNEQMALYTMSDNPDIVTVAQRLVYSGRALEDSYDRIITAMKDEENTDTTLVVVEEIYFINENLFNLTLTSVNAVLYFTGDEAPPERHILTRDEKTIINNQIWDSFGPISGDTSSTTSSRQLIFNSFTRSK